MDPIIFVTALRIFEAHVLPRLLILIESAMQKGQDPMLLDWTALYGRSIEELRAEVDAADPDDPAV